MWCWCWHCTYLDEGLKFGFEKNNLTADSCGRGSGSKSDQAFAVTADRVRHRPLCKSVAGSGDHDAVVTLGIQTQRAVPAAIWSLKF